MSRPQPLTLSFRNKAARAAWSVVYQLFYRPSPRPLHAWRRMLLRLFGARIAATARPYARVRIWAPWNLTMEADSAMGDDVDCYCVAPVHLGVSATVSQYSYLCTASHPREWSGLPMPLVAAPIVVGARAWVAADVFVGPGVTIGDGALVAARSTVLRDVAPGEVVGGSPVRPLGRRGGLPE